MSAPFRVVLNEDPSEVEEYEDTDKIRTAILGNRFTEDWLPREDTVAGTLTCSGNGDYVAVQYGLFGFSKVDVMVDGMGGAIIEVDEGAGRISVEWRDVPAAGAGATMVAVDPVSNVMTYYEVDSEGVLHETIVPSYAMVTTKPKTSYEGEDYAVDYTGMVITLYYGNDEEATDYGPTIAYGSEAWNAHVVADAGTVGEILRNGLIIVYVRPWWFQNGDQLGREYHLRAYYKAEVQGA